MGWKYTGKIWEAEGYGNEKFTLAEKLVLLFIADKVDDEGRGCYASYDTIAMKTGVDRRWVIKSVKKFKDAGVLILTSTHPQYRTNVWAIDASRLVSLPSRQEWLRQKRAVNPEYDVDEHTVLEEGGVAPLPGVALDHPGGWPETTLEGGPTPPNPSVYPSDTTGVLNNPLASKVDKSPENGTANLNKYQHNRDEEYERVPDGEEYGTEKSKAKPRTKLERLICDRTGSLYLSDPMRRKLNARVAAFVGTEERFYPSPEEQMQNHPEAFEWYINERANVYWENVGSAPSRQTLVNAAANYSGNRRKGGVGGWLDFKARWDAGKVVGQKAIKQPSPNGNGVVIDAMWFE